MAVQKANYIWRDFETDGISASGFHKPINREIRERGTWVENAINAGLSNGGLIYDTEANMNADLAHPANASAWVVSDGANNGIYRKSGASGSGSWTRIADLPYSVIYAQNDGSGTANAVVAMASVPVSTSAYSQLISVPFTAANTGAMTISINGETPRPLVTNTGEPIPAGYVKPKMSALVQIDGDGNYRLFSYGDASAIQAVIEGLLVAATAEADRAEAAAAAIATAPQWAFASKSAAALFDPDAAPSFVSLSGGDFTNALGRAELFEVLPAATPDPVDLPAPAFVRFVDGSLARWKGREFPLELGAKGDGLTDNSSFFEDLSGSMTAFNGVISADRGMFKTDKALVIPKASAFIGQGSDRTIITAKGSSALFTNTAVVSKVGPVPTRISDLSASPSKGAYLLNFTSAHGLAAGDLIFIHDPRDYSYGGDPVAGTGWRSTYHAGEYCRVLKVTSPTQIQTVGRIYSDSGYNKDFVHVYKIDETATGELRGFSVIAPGAGPSGVTYALRLQWLCDMITDDTRAAGSDNGSAYFDHVVGLAGRALDFRQSGGVGGSGTFYGFVYGNCQDMDITQSQFSGYRHAIAGGGDGLMSCVDRNIHIHHSTVRSEISMALDWHATTEWCRYTYIDMQGARGLNLSGNHNKAEHINFDVTDMALYGAEMTGTDHRIADWSGRSTDLATTWLNYAVMDIGTDNNGMRTQTKGGRLRFENIDVSAPNATGGAIHVRNRGCTESWEVRASNVKLDGPTTGIAGAVGVFGVAGSAAARIVVDDIQSPSTRLPVYVGGTDATVPVRGMMDAGKVDFTTSTSAATASVVVTFDRPFPRTPSISVSLDTYSTGSDALGTYVISASATGFTFRIARSDSPGANFSSVKNVGGYWTANSY